MGRCDYASLSGAAAAATDVEDGAQRLEHRAGGNGAAPVAAAAASRRPQFVLPPRRSCWCLHLPYWLHGLTVLQLALALAVLGRLLQPDGPHCSPPRWHVAAAAAGEAPGNLNLTQLRWVLGAQAGPNKQQHGCRRCCRHQPRRPWHSCCWGCCPDSACRTIHSEAARSSGHPASRAPFDAPPSLPPASAARSRVRCSALDTASTCSVPSRATTCAPSPVAARTHKAASPSPSSTAWTRSWCVAAAPLGVIGVPVVPCSLVAGLGCGNSGAAACIGAEGRCRCCH